MRLSSTILPILSSAALIVAYGGAHDNPGSIYVRNDKTELQHRDTPHETARKQGKLNSMWGIKLEHGGPLLRPDGFAQQGRSIPNMPHGSAPGSGSGLDGSNIGSQLDSAPTPPADGLPAPYPVSGACFHPSPAIAHSTVNVCGAASGAIPDSNNSNSRRLFPRRFPETPPRC